MRTRHVATRRVDRVISNRSTRFALAGLAVATLALPGAGDILAQSTDDDLARLAALEERLTGLEREIERIEDIKAIRRLQRAYGYYVDQKLTDQVTALFAEDATVELGDMGVYVGRDRIGAFYGRLMGDTGLADGELFNHIILQGYVTLADDGQRANGRWRALIQTGQHGESAFWGEGPYENEYVKEDGVWKFSRVHWFQTMLAPVDPGWHIAPLPMAGPLEDLPPDRPPTYEYASYPAAFQPPYHYPNPVSGRCEAGVCDAR
jgi:hypothetical protein